MVNGIKNEYPSITEAELSAKFDNGSGIHRANYKRAFIEHSWEQQQSDFAWMLLNNTISIFEGWLEELKDNKISRYEHKKTTVPLLYTI